MTLAQLEKKSLKVSRGYSYTYYIKPARNGKPTLFMIHGFPDSPDSWDEVINNYLLPNGYGAIAIVCLGYFGSSRPVETEAYNWRLVTQDLREIVENENLKKVIVLGHDWGAATAQSFYNFHADIISGVVLLNVAYSKPSTQKFDLDAVLRMTEKSFGYGTYWYWKLFTGPDGPQIADAHRESLWTAMNGQPETWLDTLCRPNGLRNYLMNDSKQPVMPYATEERQKKWLADFAEGGFDAPMNYYRAVATGVQACANADIPEGNVVVRVPFFFWGAQKDMVCRVELLQSAIAAGLLPDREVVLVDSGHWAHLDQPDKFGKELIGWLEAKYQQESRL